MVLKNINRNQALKEIKILFKKNKILYYGDISEKLNLNLELVVDICDELENKGIIEASRKR